MKTESNHNEELAVLVADVADGKAILPPGKYNVRNDETSADPNYGPLIRRVKKVAWEIRKGAKWLYVYWEPEVKPDGRLDCGYSGIRIDHEEIASWKLRLSTT